MNLEAKMQDSICIKIGKDSNVILEDEENKEEHPLVPGAMFGGEHFGFIIISDNNGKQRECFYPTQNRIEAIGIEGHCYNDLKVFENGKYHPWVFTFDGKFKKQASYNQYSKRDKKFVEEVYDLNESKDQDIFTLQKKK